MPITAREFDMVVRKFGFEVKVGDHIRAQLIIDGQVIVRTRRSHRSGDLPSYNQIRQQLRLNEAQLRDAIACPLSRDGYLDILKERGAL